MKLIYRTYADTEVYQLATAIKCPYCGREWMELDMDECGTTYTLECGNEDFGEEGCYKEFEMYFDAD